jgi:hypothetical protein
MFGKGEAATWNCTLTAEKSAVEGRPEKCLRCTQALFLDPLPAFDAAVRQFIAFISGRTED